MIDLLILTDEATPQPNLVARLFASFNVVQAPAANVTQVDVDEARVVLIHAGLRFAGTVQRIAELTGEARRRDDMLYVAPDRERVGVVQAEALGVGQVFAEHDKLDKVQAAVLAILNRDLTAGLATRSSRIASAVEITDALYRDVSAAMRANRPPPLKALEGSVSTIAAAIGSDGLSEWLSAVEMHHSQTCRHIMNVAGFASAFARHIGLDKTDNHLLTEASLLHDVGKLFIPITVLEKAGPLSPAERKAIMNHPQKGEAAVRKFGKTEPMVLAGIRSHHEYLDGTGYPDGLAGDRIPPLVRMLTIVDIFSALTEKRAYKEAMTPRLAIAEMAEMRGKLDQKLFAAFRTMVLNPVFRSQRGEAASDERLGPCLRDGRHPLEVSPAGGTARRGAA